MQRLSVTHFERPVFIIMLLFVYIYNYQTSGMGNTITNLLIILFIGIELLVIIENSWEIKSDSPLNSLFFFVSVCVISVIYSISQNDSFAKIKTLFILLLFLYALMEFLRTEDNFCFVMKAIAFCAIIAAIYLLINSDWKNGKRMDEVIGDSNQVGAYLSYSFTVVLYCWKKRLLPIYICFPAIFLLITVSMLSGSRSSLVITIISISLFSILTIKKDKYKPLRILLLFAVGIVLLVLVVYLVLTNELLYEIIGKRFVSFFEIMTVGNSSINEYSTIERSLMRDLAWEKFTESVNTFFFGNGISYFNAYFESVGGRYCFCHNNYLELLSGVGIFGTSFYYYPYLSSGILAFKNRKNVNALEAAFVLVLLIQVFLMHWFVVFYYQKLEFIFISLMIYCYRIFLNTDNTH